MGRLFKEMLVIFMGVAAAIYLVFPTLGVFELLPDAIPLIGSIDEGTATLILISVFRYYGFDLSRLFGARQNVQQQHPLIPQQRPGTAQQQPYAPSNPAETVQGQAQRRSNR